MARGHIGVPILVVECVAQQGGAVLFRGQVAGLDELAALGVVGAGELVERHGDRPDRPAACACATFCSMPAEKARLSTPTMELVSPGEMGVALKMDGDHDVGVQVVADDIGGQVVEDAAVDKVMAVVRPGREERRREWRWRRERPAAEGRGRR